MSDNKFLTSAQPKVMNPKENIKMTPEERSEGRKGLKAAVSAGLGMFPGGRAMQTLGRVGNAFANTARQYLAGRKMKNIAKKTSNFKDFHRGGRVYDRQAINDASVQHKTWSQICGKTFTPAFFLKNIAENLFASDARN